MNMKSIFKHLNDRNLFIVTVTTILIYFQEWEILSAMGILSVACLLGKYISRLVAKEIIG